MNIAMLLEMAADGGGDRLAVGPLSYADLWDQARRAATWIQAQGAATVTLVDTNSVAFPVALWGAGIAGVPFAPVNYRWDKAQIARAVARLERPYVIDGVAARQAFLESIKTADPTEPGEPDAPAVLLFTSGTSGDPKIAVLSHDNLTSYILGSVEFMGADPDEAQLVSVPPYHIAGIANLLSAVYSGRRIVQLEAFDPQVWVETVRDDKVTHAMVVPTMLGRILDVLEKSPGGLPSLRHLSYGGGRMPLPVIERAVEMLPGVSFVNAYGLTETSSTIAVLGPDDHRDALASEDPLVRRRLGSVGRPLPTVEVSVRSYDGDELALGEVGEIWVRGDQVSGAYVGVGSLLNAEGWFPTKDGGFLDDEGFLFVEGRLDDVIVRGGENISPGEVEDALLSHPHVVDVGVVGVPDDEWGEAVAAAVVISDPVTEQQLCDWVRASLRGSKVPSRVLFVEELPYNDNGKLVRRILRTSFT